MNILVWNQEGKKSLGQESVEEFAGQLSDTLWGEAVTRDRPAKVTGQVVISLPPNILSRQFYNRVSGNV